jgi:hypothetical protein
LQQLPLGGVNPVGRFRAAGMLRPLFVHLGPLDPSSFLKWPATSVRPTADG